MKRSTAFACVFGALAVAYAIFVVQAVWKRTPIDDLIDPETRLRAYHRLWVETKSAQTHNFQKPQHRYATFQSSHTAILIQKIPVPGDPDRPLYLISREKNSGGMSHSKAPWTSWDNGIQWSSWTSWFFPPDHPVAAPLLAEPGPDPVKTEHVISLLSHDGTLLDEAKPRPFRGDNCAEPGEVFYDINQDGWVERVSSGNIGYREDPELSAEVLRITRINRETEEIFHAAINVGRDRTAERWGFACRDVDGDGTWEIEIGPETETGISPEVTFFWNPASGEYESPSGKAGPHFLVLPKENRWETLKELAREGRFAQAGRQ